MPLLKTTINLGGILKSSGGAGGGGGSGQNGMPTTTVFDLDATKLDSYAGTGQTWANIKTSPADGESQTTYDFYLGNDGTANTADPTFTGSAGDSAAYWAFDGGDVFQMQNANTTFINSIHKSGAAFWIACAFRTTNANSVHAMCSTARPLTSDTGFIHRIQPGSSGLFAVYNGSGVVYINTGVGPASYSQSTDYLVIISVQAGGSMTSWVNGTEYDESTVTYTSPSASNATAVLRAAAESTSNAFPSGARMYALAIGNSTLTTEEAAAIKTEYESRHGRTY